MALSLDVKLADAYAKFGNPSFVALSPAGIATSGLPLQKPNVTIDPPENVDSTRRTITWNLDVALVASTYDAIDAIERSLATILTAVPDVAAAAGGAIPNPADTLKKTFKTVREMRDIWTLVPRVLQLFVTDLPVKYKNRQGKSLSLMTKVAVDASWMANDPTDSVNWTWIEIETHRVDLDMEHKPRGDSRVRENGRVPWAPSGDDDRVGAFDQLLHQCAVVRDRDESKVSVHVSCNAIADDRTVAIVIRSMKLEMEIAPADTRRRLKRE